PGRPVWERFAPFPFMALWLGSLGEGCWRQWTIAGPAGLVLQVDVVCLESILAVSIVPALAIYLMIRRGAPIAPMSTFGLATLAATALAAAAL
ncbi:NrsF family protein, partial [Acinetobacter baumannii]